MKLVNLHIDGFGKLSDVDIKFGSEVNVIQGYNETGKTTIHNFIRAMLFGIDTHPGRAGKKALFEGYRPWNKSLPYKGTLVIEHNDRLYKIVRDFSKDPNDLHIYGENGNNPYNPEGFLKDALCGLTESAYMNTVSIGQLSSKTGREFASELKKYAGNIQASGMGNIDTKRAEGYLEEEKKRLQNNYQDDAALVYAKTTAEIKSLEEELNFSEKDEGLFDVLEKKDQKKEEFETIEATLKEHRDEYETVSDILSECGFENTKDLNRYRDELRKLYALCVKYLRSKKSKAGIIGIVVFFILFAVCIGFLVFCLIKKPDSLPLIVTLCAAAIVCLAEAISLIVIRAGVKSKLAAASGKLSQILKKHTGEGAVSKKGMEALEDKLSTIEESLVKAEELKALIEEDEKRIKEFGKQKDEINEEIEKQQTVVFAFERKLSSLNELKNQQKELEEILEENEKIRVETEAIDLAIEKIKEFSQRVTSSIGPVLKEESSRAIRCITEGVYEEISIKDNMEINLKTGNKTVSVNDLSQGTMDQVYFAIRLAAVRTIEQGRGVLPLIFDESFVLYDNSRLKNVLKYLIKAYNGQIILFTCHSREASILSSGGVDYTLIKL